MTILDRPFAPPALAGVILPLELWERIVMPLSPATQVSLMQTCHSLDGLVRQLPALAVHQGRLASRLALARGDMAEAGRKAGAAPRGAAQPPAPRDGERLHAVTAALRAETQAARHLTSLTLPVTGRTGRWGRGEQRALQTVLGQLPQLCPRLSQLCFAPGAGQPGSAAHFDVAGLRGDELLGLVQLRRLPAASLGVETAAAGALDRLAPLLARLTSLSLLGCDLTPLGAGGLAAMSSLRSLAIEELPRDVLAGPTPAIPMLQRLRVGRIRCRDFGAQGPVVFTRLTHLTIDSCVGSYLSRTLWQLKGLVALKLSRVQYFWKLPEEVHELTALTRLHLSDWPYLEQVSIDPQRLASLERLELHRLPSLRELSVSRDRLYPVLHIDESDLPSLPGRDNQALGRPGQANAPADRFFRPVTIRDYQQLLAEFAEYAGF